MKVTVKYLERAKFSAEAGKHKIIIDQPKDKGGDDQGLNPLEFFLTSVGACVGVYAKRYAQDSKIDINNLVIEVEAELSSERPFKFSQIKIEIKGLDLGAKKEAFLNFVKNCPIHNTITSQPKVEFVV